ncbi:SatD family protein [Microbacterium paludicola]|uniref:SatD family protein n=1 Tax=Microbacterium paludicola TaxID=300019 RepID=UPI0011A6D81E|nr:SatD family protein [Microbacterium paludicola]
MPVAVIADIVGSRKLADRTAAQRILDDRIAAVDDLEPALARLTPTVGDEQQGVYEGLEGALTALLLLQLALPDDVACRFGIGVGEIRRISAPGGDIPEGPGWWAAREAIDHVHAMQLRAAPSARTWIVAAPGHDDSMRTTVDAANAYLLVRDQLVGSMSERDRRLTYGRYLGRTQRQLAEEEQITQSAVSQALSGAGAAAVLQSLAALRGAAAPARKGRA